MALKLRTELIHSVIGIGWADDSSCPKTAPCYGRCVYTVWCIKPENIAFLPFPEPLETSSKRDSRIFDLCVGVGSVSIRVQVDHYVLLSDMFLQ